MSKTSKIEKERKLRLFWRRYRYNRLVASNCRRGRELRDQSVFILEMGIKKRSRVLGAIRSDWFFDGVINDLDIEYGVETPTIYVPYSDFANDGFRAKHTMRNYASQEEKVQAYR